MRKKVKEAAWYHLPGAKKNATFDDMLKDMEKQRKKLATDDDKWYMTPKKMPKLKEIFEDFVPGGLGDNTSSDEVDSEQLKMGIEIEMEHTDDPKIAKEIALDHLTEDPKYYTKLKKMEKEGVSAMSL
jgi:hypothetical protein